MIFRTLRLIAQLEKKYSLYMTVSISLLIILSFSIKVILAFDKTLSERNGVANRFPKLFIISNVFLIKIAVVVLFYSSQQRDTIIPLFRILFSIFIGPVVENFYGVSIYGLFPWTIPYS